MPSLDDFDNYAERVANNLTRVNSQLLEVLGKRIAILRNASVSGRREAVLAGYAEADELYLRVFKAIRVGVSEAEVIFSAADQIAYETALKFYQANELAGLPLKKRQALQNLIQSVAQTTKDSFLNLSNTRMIGFRSLGLDGSVKYIGFKEQYIRIVDQAVTSMAVGKEGFDPILRHALLNIADSGIRVVDFESNYSRRLDSQLRQNILDGARDIWQANHDRVGRQFGADGVELSAHAGCAADHLPYQGKQYSHKEFAHLQDSLERQIGFWNCRHIALPILLGISRPANSDTELSRLEQLSTNKLEFEGKEYTAYEATQLQRKIETTIRGAKDRAIVATAAGDDLTRRVEQRQINILRDKYVDLSRRFELPVKAERMVVPGFKGVKMK